MKMANTAGTTGRFAVIGLLVLAMYIPLAMVDGVTSERQRYFERTMDDVADAWGGEQVISGPFLVVPELVQRDRSASEDEPDSFVTQRVILPSQLQVQVDVRHQMRSRALYEVPVYTAVLRVTGAFPVLDQSAGVPTHSRLEPDGARMVLGISHTRAISRASELTVGASTLEFESGTGLGWPGSGVQASAHGYDGSRIQPFAFEIELKGTRALGLTPVGGASSISMTSSWPHPSFSGQYLPAEQEIGADGFTARWQVHELARDLPASWRVRDGMVAPEQMLASVRLFQPVTVYRVVDRAIKYGVLFIALTFLTFVCLELTVRLRVHPVQYGVVGIALVLFYMTLLSLSEHLSFDLAYLASTILLTGMISWYVKGIARSSGLAGLTALVLGILYGVLYVLLMLEVFALLTGTAVLLAGLYALMLSTRRLKFAALAQPRPEPADAAA
jgi:inner membrane protein